MKLEATARVGALFKFTVRKADTHEITKETGWFHNLVLNSGLDRMGVGTWVDRCMVGSGNSTPIVSQTKLDSHLAQTQILVGTSSGGVQVATLPYYWYGTCTYRFNAGVATGTVAEVALGWGVDQCWNRSLIRDLNGSPISLTILADEYLDVAVEIRVYPGAATEKQINVKNKNTNEILSSHSVKCMPFVRGAAYTGSVVDFRDPSDTTKTLRVYAGDIGETNPIAVPSVQIGTIPDVETSIVNSRTIRGMARVASTSLNNIEHRSFAIVVKGLMSSSGPYSSGYKWEINPPITKANNKILDYIFELSWDRYTP